MPSPSFDKPWGISGSGDTRTITTNAIYKNRAEIVPINSNSTYTISGDFSMMTNNMVRILMFDSLPDVGSVSTKYVYNTSPYTFTTDTNTKYLLLFNSENIDTTSNNIMIEQGSQATSPEPYGIGKWYIEKNIGRYETNSNEVGIRDTYTNIDYATIPKPDNFVGYSSWDKTTIVCESATYMSETTGGWDNTNNINKISGNATQKYWWVGFTKGTTLDNMKSLLNGSIIYYPLSTPTYTEITDTYLLNQLNGLLDIELYENLCYVDWVGIQKPTMSLLYAGTEDLGIKYIITEDGKKIRTDWRKLGRRKKWKMK